MNGKSYRIKGLCAIFMAFLLFMIPNGMHVNAEEMALELESVKHASNYSEIARIKIEDERALETSGLVDSKPFNIDESQIELSKDIVIHAGTFASRKEDTIESIVGKEAKGRREKYSITIGVEQPNPGTYDCAALEYSDSKDKHVSGYAIGHTFIVLGNHSKKEYTYLARGFYPKNILSGYDVLNNISVVAAIGDDTGHTFSARKTYWVDLSTYNKAVQIISNKSKSVW